VRSILSSHSAAAAAADISVDEDNRSIAHSQQLWADGCPTSGRQFLVVSATLELANLCIRFFIGKGGPRKECGEFWFRSGSVLMHCVHFNDLVSQTQQS